MVPVNRKLVEVPGHLYVEAPKYRKCGAPSTTSARRGLPAGRAVAARVEQPRAEQDGGANPLGLIFPAPGSATGGPRTSTAASSRPPTGGRVADAHGRGAWTWHSLRHVFCTTALFTWKLDATDVSRMAPYANYRITLDMYVGTTAGVLDRARQATQ